MPFFREAAIIAGFDNTQGKRMALLDNALTRRLNTPYPFWQAPLPFDLVSPAYAGQISAAGALGLLRVAPFATCQDLQNRIDAYRTHHDRPAFCFYHSLPREPRMDAIPTWENESFFAGLALTPIAPAQPDSFEDLLGTAIAANPRAIGFARGLPDKDYITALREQGIFTFAVCGNVAEAVTAEIFNLDAIVLHGMEAGGERSGFDNRLHAPEQSAASLLQQVRREVRLPLVVWGDFADSADIVAAILGGAQSVMLDRPWLACHEAQLSPAQQDTLQHGNEFDSTVSQTYTRHPMRHLRHHAPLPGIDSINREALWHSYFTHHPEQRPLSVAASIATAAADLHALLEHYRQGIRQFLA